MTATFWIVLLVLAAAIAVATMRRKRPESRLAEAQRLPPRDELRDLGLSPARPATPRDAAAPDATESVARPVSPRPAPAARPVVQSVATPVASPAARVARPSDWVQDALADEIDETDAPLDARRLDADELDVPIADAPPTLDASDLIDPAALPDAADPSDLDGAEPDADGADADDDAVWTFDHAAAEPAGDPATRAAYVRDGQALWPDDAAAPALLAASLGARLGGSVAILRHDADTYLVEMLAGPAAVTDPEPLDANGHPLHRVPQDGVLSLLGPSTDLPYLGDAAVGQVLVRSLGVPPSARVLLVADVPADAPDVDGPTAALVDRYAELLADLTHLPLADDLPEDAPALDVDDDLLEILIAEPATEPGLADAEQQADETPEMPEVTEPAGLTHARDTTVAVPGARRGAVPPPPRGVILAGEIEAARRDRRLLVFALVTVADAETVLRSGPDDVVRAEATLRQRLTAGAGVRRVEPFGDLLFGVFLDAEGPEVVAWAERISAQGRPLLVGAVPATGVADLVRATATAALQSAYEREVVCVVAS